MSNKDLAGDEAPSAKLILKWLGIVLGLAALTMVVVGLLLPREWEVERSVEIEADHADIFALVANVERWDRWMFDPEAPEALEVQVEPTDKQVGSTISWSGGGSRGTMTLVEVDPDTGIRWDGKIESDEVNNHGELRLSEVGEGRWKVTIVDTGELPPVIGGYFVPAMNAGLGQHFEGTLARLSEAAAARKLERTMAGTLGEIEAAGEAAEEAADALEAP